MKENKYYSHLNFWLPIGYVFAMGIFLIKRVAQLRFCIGIKRTNGKVKNKVKTQKHFMKITVFFLSILPFRLDAIGDIDLSHDGSQSSGSPLHANASSWSPVISSSPDLATGLSSGMEATPVSLVYFK
jgi:hypothetical protein